jgi:hypothetical protein
MRHLLSLGLALALSLAAHAQSISIRVVDAATGAAVKDADVRAVVVEHVEKRRGERIRISELDLWEAERETTNLRAVSDAEGRATIELGTVDDPESFVLLSATSGALWAGHAVSFEWAKDVKLRLEPDFALEVHVFDAAGQPASGVPVEYTQEPKEVSRVVTRTYIACATSDARGIARFPHAQEVLGFGTHETNLLWARVPTVKRVQLGFDPTQRPLPKLELHLPPCGSVRFRFENEFHGRVLLRHADSRTSDRGFLGNDMDRWRVEVREGVALFPYVEPGVALQYDLDPPKSARSPAVRFLGPKAVGETREVTPGKRMPSRGVVAKLIDSHRVPLRDCRFNLQALSHFDMGMSIQITSAFHRKTTDADGRIAFGISSEAASTVELHFKVDGVGEWRGLVPEQTTSDVIDLGELVLAPIVDPELLASLDDDALEAEFLRVHEFAKVATKWQKERVPLELLVLEMARRGGERWITFLRSRFDEAARDSTRPDWYLMDELTWLIALRRAQRRPDPCRLELHPEDLSRAAFGLPTHVRVALRNVDPEESFVVGNGDHEHVVAALAPFGGTTKPEPNHARKSRGGMWKEASVRPGELSSSHEDVGWWDIDLSERFELGEGDWTLRLEYVPSFDSESKGEPVGMKVAAEPFVLRVRAAK